MTRLEAVNVLRRFRRTLAERDASGAGVTMVMFDSWATIDCALEIAVDDIVSADERRSGEAIQRDCDA